MISYATLTVPTRAGAPSGVPVTDWPVNRECLAQFQTWLLEGGYSVSAVRGNYAMVARAALSALPRPYWACQPDEVIARARAALKQRSDLRPQTKRVYQMALQKLREFLLFQRGSPVAVPDPLALPPELAELPDWVRAPLSRYLRLKQRNWPARTVRKQTRELFQRLRRVLRFFMTPQGVADWSQLSARRVDDYVDAALRRGLTPGTINWELTNLRMFGRFLQEEGYAVPEALTRVKLLEMPRRLPRPLSDDQVHQLEKCIQSAIAEAPTDYQRQRAVMDLAWFYLLWHCGLRLSEVRDLRVNDLDLMGRKLFVRDTKERKDRAVYLSDTTVQALRLHLTTRADREAAGVFSLHRRTPTLVTLERRLARYGERVGVSVTPHQLRHTFASQMLAAGMPITSLQRYLGHEELDTTMIYAEVSDPMLQQDYYRGIASVDPPSARLGPPDLASRQAELRRLIEDLQTPELAPAHQRMILEQMQHWLDEPSGKD